MTLLVLVSKIMNVASGLTKRHKRQKEVWIFDSVQKIKNDNFVFKAFSIFTLTLSLRLRDLKLLMDSLLRSGGREMSALNFMKRMFDACVSSTIRVALGKHLNKKQKKVSLWEW